MIPPVIEPIVMPSAMPSATIDAAKRRQLPAWIREGINNTIQYYSQGFSLKCFPYFSQPESELCLIISRSAKTAFV